MPLVAAAILPHAPALLPGVAGAREPLTEELRAAVDKISLGAADLLVVVSPHGRRSGVYENVRGSLSGFGLPHVTGSFPSDADVVDVLSRAWGQVPLDEEVDHGVLVPLLLMDRELPPVVACTIQETTGAVKTDVDGFDEGRGVAGIIGPLLKKRRIALIASAQGSAALTPGAPLTHRPAGVLLDEAILEALRRNRRDLERIPDELWERGGSCSGGVLVAFGRVAEGREIELLAYEHPFGVGYFVAQVEPK